MSGLILKRASASRLSGQWRDDDYDVLCDGEAVGRIMLSPAAPSATPWFWSLAYGYHRDRSPTHGMHADAEGGDGGRVCQELAVGLRTGQN